jgi:formylglycine-generating enzyme required for sulfatase activity
MADEPKHSWITTLPGILTAVGTLLGAVTALILALNQVGFLGGGKNIVLAETAPRPETPSAVALPATPKLVAASTCPTCPEMVVIPSGSFLMGSPKNEPGRGENEDDGKGNQVSVAIDRPFEAGKFEVTFAQWHDCAAGGGCKRNPSPSDNGWGGGDRPVINVSWEDIGEFLVWLNTISGAAADRPYRLLTESEWEYAARAGTLTPYPWGAKASHDNANYGAETCCSGAASGKDLWEEQTAPVGRFDANAFGLHDMHGNVWEWVADCYFDTYETPAMKSAARQETGGECEERSVRGGAWDGDPVGMRSANRFGEAPSTRNEAIGFRVARDL